MDRFKDSSAIAEAVRNHEVSAFEIVEETIKKAEAINPQINAIVSNRYEEAMAEAKVRDFNKKPFAGVPIFIKDLGQDLNGLPSTSGSSLFQDYHPR